MWLHGMKKTTSLNSGEGQDIKNFKVTAGTMSMRNGPDLGCKYCLMCTVSPRVKLPL